MDAAQYLRTSDKVSGKYLDLSARITPAQLDIVSQSEDNRLIFRIFIVSSFDMKDDITFNPYGSTVELAGRIFNPDEVKDCDTKASLNPNPSFAIIPKANDSRGSLCLLLYYNTARPSDWSLLALRIRGLRKGGNQMIIPDIHYTKTKRYVARCNGPNGNKGLYCSNED